MPFARRPLALLLCCGFASALGGTLPEVALAQGMTPLSVDPTLLGLPPAQPKPRTTAQPQDTTATSRPAEPAPRATVTPIPTPAAPESKPLPRQETEAPARNATPAAAVPAAPVAAPTPAAAPAPVPTPTPAATPARPVAAAATPLAASDTQAPVSRHSALAPLRVDPALLGLPPTPAPQVATTAPQSATTARPATATAPGRATRPPLAAPATVQAREAGAMPPQIVDATIDPQAEAEAMAAALPPRRRRDEPPSTGAAPLPYVERDPGPALALRRSRNTAPPKNDDPHPTFLTASRIYGATDREAVLEGDAEMRRAATTITSDKLVYWQNNDEVEATGNVVYTQEGTVVSGPSLKMKLGEQTGVFDQAAYTIHQERKVPVWGVIGYSQATGTSVSTGRGQSEKLNFLGENHIQLANATYTTCAPGNNDWYAKASSLDLNYETETGEGEDSTLYFKDVPIFRVPSMSFPLNNRRKSGFLSPTFGTDSRSGAMFTAPYYWNIAPNMDLTVAPKLMTRRGLQVGGELRYLNYDYNGYFRGEYVPTDNVRNLNNRYAFNFIHNQNFGGGFFGSLNLNKASDDYFYTDLSSRIGVSAQTLLPRQGVMNYQSTWWKATANVTRYQTLQPDINNPVVAPYDVVPQLTLNARRPDYFGTDVALWAQYTSFSHPTKITGDRSVIYPQLSVPFTTPAFYVTPKMGVHVTNYTFGHQTTPGAIDTYSRNVPIFSLDGGMTLERETTLLGSTFTQTLEPRLYYLYVPYRDHSPLYKQNVNFDTGLADFNFGQIFAENRYVGQDYIGDANQLTAAVTTRFINPNNGREYFRALLGQRYYFGDQRVVLPGEQPRQHKNTNWLAAVSGQVMPKTYVDGALEYNPYDSRTDRLTLTGRYQPELGKLINAGYRYTRDVLGNLDVSGQWPLGGGWYGVGRYNYSLKEKRVVENIGGLEYNGGCWVVRGVIQRYALTANTSSTAFFVQLELNDFSSIGSSPLDMLRRTIPGYGRINQPVADPVFGNIE